MKQKLFAFIILLPMLLLASNNNKEGYATVSGYIQDEDGEELIGANVFVKNNNLGTVTNIYGFYSLTLPIDEYTLTYSYVGYDPIDFRIDLSENRTMDIKLDPVENTIAEVSVSALRKDVNISNVGMGNVKLQTKQIKKIPVLFGEIDVIKTIQLLPGVQMVGEGNSGFFVRGGSVDQNLILLDEATVYNPSHIGGIFSVFNGDALKGVDLYKGGIPASYGGRLSSVLDVRMKEGNMNKLNGNFGVGVISSRMTLEGPLVKNQSSFVLSGRRTYADLFFPFSNKEMVRKSRMYFYDLTGKVNWVLGDKDRVFLSAYTGRDIMKFGDMFAMEYGNLTATLRWNHVYNSRLFSNFTIIMSNFDYELGQPEGAFAFNWTANVIDKSVKNDYTFYINPMHTLRFGFQSIYHTIKPGKGESIGESNLNFENNSLEPNYAIENALFAENEHKVSDRLTLRYGLRFSHMYNIGESTIYKYEENVKGDMVPNDSTKYGKGEFFNPNHGWEPRLGARYLINTSSSVKVGYDRTYQYIHLATNTAASTPLDVWFLSNPNIKPQYADQFSAGYFRNFFENTIETSVEVYYKKMYDAIDFKDHAILLLNKHFDGELRRGEAYSYGVELFVRKQQGRFTGWVSYTYAKTRRQIEGINDGKEYKAPYDKPHDLKIVGSCEINDRFSLSANWVFSSAAPYTIAKEWYKHENLWVPHYSERNQIRLNGTEYHRLDLSLTINFLKAKSFDHNLNVGVYNAYNRHNLYSILYEQPKNEDRPPTMQKMYLFGVIPNITYNINF
jgi:hypothetical protein